MGGTSQDITSTKDAEQALGLLSAMATTANEASRLVDVVPSIIADVATHTGWRPVAAWMVEQDGRLDPVDGDVRQVLAPDQAEALRLARQAVQTRDPAVGTTSEGTTLVAAPIVAEGRAACVIVMDSRVNTPPTESDSATVGQATALFARVAEREWTGERLAAARDDAMAASVAKSEFLATMSHEIRTPLNGVIGLSELLSRTELTERQRRLADGIDNAGRQLLALVNDILDLSKIEAGRLELEQVDFDPRSVIEQSSTIVAEQARRKALELVVSCQPDLPTAVCGDPVRFGQVIANLTANAVKFTSSGEVVVRASLEPAAQDDTVVLRVEVTDTGSGMTPEVQARLFTAFSQGDTSTTREFGGTGLGLAISRQIVSAMGGEIGVTSTRGRGSTFWFTAPFAPAADLPVPASSGTAIVSGLRVLVVDDNDTNRFILEEQLASWKVDTSVAGSGVEGLSLLDEAHRRGAPFDIVLLDYLMPGVNGEQFARMVRGDGRFADTRIILLSSSMDLHASTLNEAGIDLALTKPVFASSLFDSLATVAASAPATTGQSSRRGSEVTGPTPGGPPGAHGRVLVVEDNAVNQMVAVGILESLGYAASVAENGAVGVATFVADPTGVDVILMDCQMPQMDGYAATRAIRAQEAPGTRVPIIAMTAAAIAGERERCLLAGMDDFLTKPVDVGLLRSTLGRWVPTRQPEADAPGAVGRCRRTRHGGRPGGPRPPAPRGAARARPGRPDHAVALHRPVRDQLRSGDGNAGAGPRQRRRRRDGARRPRAQGQRGQPGRDRPGGTVQGGRGPRRRGHPGRRPRARPPDARARAGRLGPRGGSRNPPSVGLRRLRPVDGGQVVRSDGLDVPALDGSREVATRAGTESQPPADLAHELVVRGEQQRLCGAHRGHHVQAAALGRAQDDLTHRHREDVGEGADVVGVGRAGQDVGVEDRREHPLVDARALGQDRTAQPEQVHLVLDKDAEAVDHCGLPRNHVRKLSPHGTRWGDAAGMDFANT